MNSPIKVRARKNSRRADFKVTVAKFKTSLIEAYYFSKSREV